MASVQKELREIEDAARERGFEFRESNGHKKVYFRDQPVMMGDPEDRSTWKPVTIPSTPSDPRWRDNLVATLVRAKVLERDPKDEGQQGLSDEDRERREAERELREGRQAETQAARQTQAEEARERARQTADFRERAADTLGRLGVWQKGARGGSFGQHQPRRSVSEAARLAFAWAERTNFEPRPKSASSAEMAMKKLFEGGGGLADETRQFFGAFLDLLEESADPVALYFDMLREELGLYENGEDDESAEPAAAAAAAQGDGDQPGPEPLHTEAEDDAHVRDLRERLKAREAELVASEERRLAEGRDAEAMLDEMQKRLETMPGGKVPELAFECLVEMLGQHVTVAGEDGSADLASVISLMETKKERAVALAKQVAALEVGA